MLSLPTAVKLWYCPDPVDMRLGFDGLFSRVAHRLKADPLSGHLFIFRNRTADHLKVCTGAAMVCACGANAWKPAAITSPTPRRTPFASS